VEVKRWESFFEPCEPTRVTCESEKVPACRTKRDYWCENGVKTVFSSLDPIRMVNSISTKLISKTGLWNSVNVVTDLWEKRCFLVVCPLLFDAHQRNDVFCEVSNRFKSDFVVGYMVSFSRRPQGVHQSTMLTLTGSVKASEMVQRRKWKSLNVYPMRVSILFLSCCKKAMREEGKASPLFLLFLFAFYFIGTRSESQLTSIPSAWLIVCYVFVKIVVPWAEIKKTKEAQCGGQSFARWQLFASCSKQEIGGKC